MPKLKWEAPPENNRRVGSKERIDKEVAAVRRRPGEWLKVREGASSGSYVTYKKRGCTVRTSSEGDGHYTIYIKWDPASKSAQDVMAEERKAAAANGE